MSHIEAKKIHSIEEYNKYWEDFDKHPDKHHNWDIEFTWDITTIEEAKDQDIRKTFGINFGILDDFIRMKDKEVIECGQDGEYRKYVLKGVQITNEDNYWILEWSPNKTRYLTCVQGIKECKNYKDKNVREIDFGGQSDVLILKNLFKEWDKDYKFVPYANIHGFFYMHGDTPVSMGFLSTYHRTPCSDSPNGFVAECCGVYTKPEYRGRGYATTIINSLIEFGRQIKLDYIHCDSFNTSKNIYVGCGFLMQDKNECRLWYNYKE